MSKKLHGRDDPHPPQRQDRRPGSGRDDQPLRPLPYTPDLGDRDPIAAIRETGDRIAGVDERLDGDRFERSYAPGKWTARQILTHLAQTELALGTRARMALIDTGATSRSRSIRTPGSPRARGSSGREALDAFVALARMNGVLFEGLSPADRAIAVQHIPNTAR